MKKLILLLFSAFSFASPLFADMNFTRLRASDKMPTLDFPYTQEFFMSRDKKSFGFVRRYNTGEDKNFEAESFHMICGENDEVPYLISIKYKDVPEVLLYHDLLQRDGIIDSVSIVPYPYASSKPTDSIPSCFSRRVGLA